MKNQSGSPSPGNTLCSHLLLAGRSLVKGSPVAARLAFILLCLGVSIGSASAQTRSQNNASGKSEERMRRVESSEKADGNDPFSNNKSAVAQPPLVRKTALTYSPRSEKGAVERPSLTNDLIIISRAEDSRGANYLKKAPAAAYVPSIWPVVGPLRSGVGMRSNPFGGPGTEFHKGQDIAAPTGTPVNVTADGIVIIARWVKGYGNGIYVDHGNGITTRYGHLSRIDVVEGQPVKKGQHLGLVGSTGRSTGPHLHYEVRINGQPTSPLAYLPSLAPATPAAPESDTQQRGVQH
ncbi:MAG: hypothetical protein QOJ64_2814 [Acidobacteriota bacterium]|jgi:murein DD-endopeptidase MepM/ murein hydrolase activator NlpD|nr:hypothetical protein [Acidobacteriota bacterium]